MEQHVPAQLLTGHDSSAQRHASPVLHVPTMEKFSVGELSFSLLFQFSSSDDALIHGFNSIAVCGLGQGLVLGCDPFEDCFRFGIVALGYKPSRGLGEDCEANELVELLIRRCHPAGREGYFLQMIMTSMIKPKSICRAMMVKSVCLFWRSPEVLTNGESKLQVRCIRGASIVGPIVTD